VSSMYAFGVRGFDTAAALALMDKSSNGGTTQGQAIRGRESGYLSRHYIFEVPSDSLEYSATDLAVAQVVKSLGDTSKLVTDTNRSSTSATSRSTACRVRTTTPLTRRAPARPCGG